MFQRCIRGESGWLAATRRQARRKALALLDTLFWILWCWTCVFVFLLLEKEELTLLGGLRARSYVPIMKPSRLGHAELRFHSLHWGIGRTELPIGMGPGSNKRSRLPVHRLAKRHHHHHYEELQRHLSSMEYPPLEGHSLVINAETSVKSEAQSSCAE